METSLDRREVLLLGRPQADDAVAKWWIRNRERGDDDRSGSLFSPRDCQVGKRNLACASVSKCTLTTLLCGDAQALACTSRAGCSGSGNCATSVVPPPDGLSSVIVPPNASILSFSPSSPEPRAGSAPPTPSSRTQTQRRPSRSSTVTSIRDASACFVVFVSVSATT